MRSAQPLNVIATSAQVPSASPYSRTAGDGDEALDVVSRERPDVVLMDIRMPVRDGVAVTVAITADPDVSGPLVLVLTTFDLDAHIHAGLRSGASGFLLKDTYPRDLLAAVHLVAQGESVLAPTLVRRLISAVFDIPAAPARPVWVPTLTPRETEVLVAVALGLSNAEIGTELHMSTTTAKTHVSQGWPRWEPGTGRTR